MVKTRMRVTLDVREDGCVRVGFEGAVENEGEGEFMRSQTRQYEHF